MNLPIQDKASKGWGKYSGLSKPIVDKYLFGAILFLVGYLAVSLVALFLTMKALGTGYYVEGNPFAATSFQRFGFMGTFLQQSLGSLAIFSSEIIAAFILRSHGFHRAFLWLPFLGMLTLFIFGFGDLLHDFIMAYQSHFFSPYVVP